MIEIRIHGRGGQGGVTLAKIIANSRFLRGDSVQAFGLYAAERSGAPIQAFCRYDREPIADRNLIYEPDHVIVLDATLVGESVTSGLRSGGWILINSSEPPERFTERFPGNRIATVDATAVARAHGLGTRSVPIVNTALAGAAARLLGFDLADVRAALEHLGLAGPNLEAATEAHERVRSGPVGVRLAAAEPEAAISAEPEGTPPPEAEPTVPSERPAARAAPPPLPEVGRGPSFLEGEGGGLPGIRTGAWATEQPRRQQWVPPCNHVCPAGNDVQAFLHALAEKETDRALGILLRTTPFPSVCGRVCPAPCMDSCNRIHLDGAVNVRQLERWAGDHGRAAPTTRARREQRVAVIGSGPGGLSAAYQAARLGYRTTVFEGDAEIGGLLRTGIPEYRLPREVLDREIGRILELGVEVEASCPIGGRGLMGLARGFDAVLVATGLQELRGLGLAGTDHGVEQGIEFLDRARRDRVRVTGEHVVVAGGGNTAVDAARTALRLGAGSVRIVYRRSREEMPAIPSEVDEGLEEGVRIDFLTRPVALHRGPAGNGPGTGPGRRDGRHPRLVCRRMELGEPDASGRPHPVEVPGSDFGVRCDRLILALGQSPDLSLFPEGTEVREGREVLGRLETPVYAVGDLATGDGTVAGAIGSGRRAAFRIHAALTAGRDAEGRTREPGPGVPGAAASAPAGAKGSGRGSFADPAASENPGTAAEHAEPVGTVEAWRDEVISHDALRLHLFEREPAAAGEALPPSIRASTFDEVHAGLADPGEARRCLSCGVCNECDLCVTYCPDGVLARAGPELVFDYDYCKGCAVCVTECPRDALFMSPLS